MLLKLSPITYLEKLSFCCTEDWEMLFIKLSRTEIGKKKHSGHCLNNSSFTFKFQDKVNIIDC